MAENVSVSAGRGYTGVVTVGKTAESLRQLPQSVSVLTRQRLDDQNVTSLPEALKYATATTVIRNSLDGNLTSFCARGYQSDYTQVDGVNLESNGNLAAFDLAIYDRIDVQRGVSGLFNGTGNPGVTVNLAGGGVRAVSDFFAISGAVRWQGKGYAIAALKLGYPAGRHVGLALNVENLFDRTYYETVSAGGAFGNYYGAPRSVMLTVRTRF